MERDRCLRFSCPKSLNGCSCWHSCLLQLARISIYLVSQLAEFNYSSRIWVSNAWSVSTIPRLLTYIVEEDPSLSSHHGKMQSQHCIVTYVTSIMRNSNTELFSTSDDHFSLIIIRILLSNSPTLSPIASCGPHTGTTYVQGREDDAFHCSANF